MKVSDKDEESLTQEELERKIEVPQVIFDSTQLRKQLFNIE